VIKNMDLDECQLNVSNHIRSLIFGENQYLLLILPSAIILRFHARGAKNKLTGDSGHAKAGGGKNRQGRKFSPGNRHSLIYNEFGLAGNQENEFDLTGF
jgi:hypothetical protein